jgi:AAA15 family ATPase/GTPase
MLKSFAVRNFQSFHEQVQISLELNKHTPDDNRAFQTSSGSKLTKALAVIGPNASGKTTLIKSLAFLDWFIRQSFQSKVDALIPLNSHFSASNEASEFEIEFEMDGKDWRYRLIASEKRVYSEHLYCKLTRAYSYVFTREWNPCAKNYEIKQNQFGFLQREAERVRENASLLSTAAQYQVPLALTICSMQVFTNLHVMGRHHIDDWQIFGASALYSKNDHLRLAMTKLLRGWDLGLSDIRIERQTVTHPNGEKEDIYIPFGIHKVDSIEHSIMLKQESSGTQAAYLLLSRLLPVLTYGGIAVIDELEADLHPHILVPILDLFFSPETNPHNAQIIFTCHSIEVLSLLHKAQVVLVEKDGNCQSNAWRLDEVKGIRADDNLYAKYMGGSYGAIPQI